MIWMAKAEGGCASPVKVWVKMRGTMKVTMDVTQDQLKKMRRLDWR